MEISEDSDFDQKEYIKLVKKENESMVKIQMYRDSKVKKVRKELPKRIESGGTQRQFSAFGASPSEGP